MAEYICLQSHCGECNHMCVESHLFDGGKRDKVKLALDPLVHRFDEYNQVFILTGELAGIYQQSSEEMLQMTKNMEEAVED